MSPLAPRTAVSSLGRALYLGAHVSAAGGVAKAVPNSTHIGGNSFALFLKSQRKWASPPLTDQQIADWHAKMKSEAYSYDHVLPHGSYLVNLAQADHEKADKAYANFVDDLKRCDRLGIKLYNFHPGSTGGAEKPQALARISAQLNRAHTETEHVVTVIENMAGSGNVVGGDFTDLRDIIAGVKNKSRVGVCIDTCHAFAAGYDMRSPASFAETMQEFDKVVGLGYLRALHLNDSKAPLASNRDVHANIGTGFLGLRAFHNVVNFEAFQNLPMVLETPIDRKLPNGKTEEDKSVWAKEIKLLERLIGMDVEGNEFLALEAELAKQGREERDRLRGQVERRAEKATKKATKKVRTETKGQGTREEERWR